MLPKVTAIHTKINLEESFLPWLYPFYPCSFSALSEPTPSFLGVSSHVSVCADQLTHGRSLVSPPFCHVSSELHTCFKAFYFLMFTSRWWTEKEKEDSQRWKMELTVTIPQTPSVTFAVFTTSSCYVG